MVTILLHDEDAAEVLRTLYQQERRQEPALTRTIDALKCALDVCDCGRMRGQARAAIAKATGGA